MAPTPVRSLLVLPVLAVALACGGEKAAKGPPEPAPAPEPAAKAPAHSAPKPAQKVKVVDGPPPNEKDRYALAVEPPEVAHPGEAAKVKVAVTPKAPWHMNLDFPTSLELKPPADVKVSKPKLGKADAARLDENGAAFEVELTPAAPGSKALTGTFKFAVCQEEACSPVTETITFSLNVAPKS